MASCPIASSRATATKRFIDTPCIGCSANRSGAAFAASAASRILTPALLAWMAKPLDESLFHLGDCAISRSYWAGHHTGEALLIRPTWARDAVEGHGRFLLTDYPIAREASGYLQAGARWRRSGFVRYA
jgi:hypothetical protein